MGSKEVRLAAWSGRLLKAVPADPPAATTGVFRSDSDLKALLKVHAKGCPASASRSDLLAHAVRLGLLSGEDALVAEPRKAKGTSRTWGQCVDAAAARPLPRPLSDDSTVPYATSSLVRLLEAHVGGGQVAPAKIARATLLEQAVRLGLLTKEQADVPLPSQLPEEELKRRWKAESAASAQPSSKSRKMPSGRKALTAALLELNLVTPAEAEARISRPDRAGAMKLARESVQVTRCTSVKSLFKGIADAESIRTTLETLSSQASKLFYERSFLVWIHLHRLVTTGQPLPDMDEGDLGVFVRRAYTIGTQNSSISDPPLKTTLGMYKKYFPSSARPDGYNLVTHAANAYAAALERHFCNLDVVKARVRRYASSQLLDYVIQRPEAGEEDAACTDFDTPAVSEELKARRKEVGHAPVYNVLSALEDMAFDVGAMHSEQRRVLDDVRAKLGLPEGTPLTDRWLRKNIHSSIRFALHVASTFDQVRAEAEAVHRRFEQTISDERKRPKLRRGATRGATFVPLNHLKRRCVMLDATDLAAVLKLPAVEGSLVSEMVRATFQKNIQEIFGKEYDPDVAGSGAWTFSGTIDTDGVDSVHLHFHRRKQKSDAARIAKKARKKGATAAKAASSASADREGARVEAPPRLLLLVDPGRVNVASVTAMLDGKVLTVGLGKKKARPLKFVFGNRQYYTLAGTVRRESIRTRRERRNDAAFPEAKQLRAALSSATLRTANVESVLAHLSAHLDRPSATEQTWKRALGRQASADRWRSRATKDGAILRWFYGVKRKVQERTGLGEATVVWGDAKVAATGRGNLSVPTDRIAQLASRVRGWTVVSGDEFRSSKQSCIEPHPENLSPRFRGEKVQRRVRRSERVEAQVRDGFVTGLKAKRMLRRVRADKVLTRIGEKEGKRSKECTKWTYEGHSGEDAAVKARMREVRETAGLSCRYVRGLRVYKDQNNTKFVDRDVNGSINIGWIWIWDHVRGRVRPQMFIRGKLPATA